MSGYTRKTLPRELALIDDWPSVSTVDLDSKILQRFSVVRDLIETYLGGHSVRAKLAAIRMPHCELLRLFNRCVAFDANGKIVGWPALLLGFRVAAYTRKKKIVEYSPYLKGGYSGAMGALFADRPQIQEQLDQFLLTGRRRGGVPESRVTLIIAHREFLRLCELDGVPQITWPFCVQRLGIGAMGKYLQRFYDQHYDAIVDARYGEFAAAKTHTGKGYPSRLRATLPYDIAEIDEHKVHFLGSIGLPTPKGLTYVPVERIQIIIMIDRFTKAVLAYTVTFRKTATGVDILRTVAKALMPWEPRAMALPGFVSPANSGFPSQCFDVVSHCGVNIVLFDNASAHLAEAVMSPLAKFAGCAVNYGMVAHFERRPVVESIFSRLEQAGFVRVPSTTGSHSNDPRRRNAEAKAVDFKISVSAVLDLIEGVVVEYNSSLPGGNFGETPLGLIKRYLDDASLGFLPPTLPPRLAHEPSLATVIETRRIAGSRQRGDRPHLTLDHARYTSPELANRWDLISATVQVHINEDDITRLEIYHDSGQYLGMVKVQGAWAGTPHSRETRKHINAALDAGQLSLRRGISVVTAWFFALEEEAIRQSGSKKRPTISQAASRLAEEQRMGNYSPQPLDVEVRERTGLSTTTGSGNGARTFALIPDHTSFTASQVGADRGLSSYFDLIDSEEVAL